MQTHATKKNFATPRFDAMSIVELQDLQRELERNGSDARARVIGGIINARIDKSEHNRDRLFRVLAVYTAK